MSTISASTTSTTAYKVTADTTGALVLQTGATPTTAVTISSAQVVTLANALAVTSGGTGVTTSTGSGAVVLGTSPTLTTPNIDSAQIPTVSGTAPLYMARAWVNFNGTGTVAIRGSGNVTSITDNGTGDYTINFTTAMSDTNYSISTSAVYMNGDNNSLLLHGPKNRASYSNAFATTSVRVQSSDQNQTATDSGVFCVGVFR